MQSVHYNSGSIKLTRERSTMVSRWETNEVARWIGGLAGIDSDISDIFCKYNVDGAALSLLLREDIIQMGITKLDQQLILMQSIDLLLTLANRLTSETLALLFMRIHCAATTCFNLLKRPDDKEPTNDNSNIINSPEFYTSISNLSDIIVLTCHWLGRLPFIENIEYIDLRRKIIKVLVQIRVLLRNFRLNDQINMPKTKLIVEINKLRTTTICLVRGNKDSLFSSDCYLTRVHLRRPLKDDVNIEYTTMPDYTHVISSIETEAISFLGSGFNAINIGDEIIEINNQVVVGWDPIHFTELLRTPSHCNEICLLVKKMPRHNDDEVYTKRLMDGPQNPRRSRARGALERRNQQTQENRTMLLEQDGEIEIESDDEALYQSKRSSQIKRDQHSSLPDLSETLANSNNPYDNNEQSDHNIPSSTTSSVSTTALISPTSPIKPDSTEKNKGRLQSASGNQSAPNLTPKSPKKTGIESYFGTLFRTRQDAKSVIADMNDHPNKIHPQLVNIKRIHSIHKQTSSTSLHDEQNSTSPPISPMNKSSSQTSLQTISSARSSLSNLFKSSDHSDKNRRKQSSGDTGKAMTFRNELKMEITSIFNNNSNTIANKPPLNHNDSRKHSDSIERRRLKRTPSYNKNSCKDLGRGDCEGFLYRYLPKGTISFVQWKRCWCVLKGGTLYVFKSRDDKNQGIEIKLEGKNVSPAPERRKYGFRIADEYFSCATRDEMAKWMNIMGLAAINFNIDDSKIAGFNKGFVDSREGSPATTPIIGAHPSPNSKQQRKNPISSAGDSENDSDKESTISWQRSVSHHSSISDVEPSQDKVLFQHAPMARPTRSSSSSASLPVTNINPIESTSNHLGSHTNMSTSKGHHRTCSTPIRFPPAYEDEQENAYVNAAPRLSESDSLNEHSYQRMFVNSKILNDNQIQEHRRFPDNYPPLMLNSSGGFATPSAVLSSTSSDMTSSFSPPPITSFSQQHSTNSIFLLGDEELSPASSRSASYSRDRPNSLSEDPSSPVFQTDSFSPPINITQRSSSSSSQQHSSNNPSTSPLYISVSSSAPSKPRTNDMNPLSAPPITEDDLYFTGRSPPSTSRKTKQSNKTIKQLITTSMQHPSDQNLLQQQIPSTSVLKHHRFPSKPSEEEQNDDYSF